MLQIRLSKPSSESGGGAKYLPSDTVTVACPDHLVLADLPVAKSLGSANAASLLKSVGRRSRRQLGERVHFCVRCDFPISIYGRLNPCEHAFCLDCARSDSLCYLCDERIQKIQTIKLMEGIFICAAPHCLKSFMKKTEFEIHIHENHSDLLHQTPDKDGNFSESASTRRPAVCESTVQASPRPLFSPSSGAQVHDREDKAHLSQTREQQPPRPLMQPMTAPPFAVPIQNLSVEQQSDNNPPPGFERPITQNQFPQQGMGGGPPFPPEYPMHMPQPPGFAAPMSSNPGLAPQFGYHPQFTPDGVQPFYGASYEMPRPDSNPDMGSEQGSLLGFPPGAAPRQWNMGQPGRPFEPTPADGGFVNVSDPQGRASFFQGQSGNSMDNRDSSTGVLMPQPLAPLPPPPPLPHHMSQLQRGGRHYSGDTSHDGQGFGWQHDKRDGFGSSQD